MTKNPDGFADRNDESAGGGGAHPRSGDGAGRARQRPDRLRPVVGLDGSGDQTMQTPFTTQSLSNMLSQLGITVPPGTNMQLKNVAAVMVTAKLPPFSRAGQNIDVVVSSMGNAKSLRGGTLLMTPLKGVDNQVMRWRRVTCWSAARARRPAAAACRSTSWRVGASATAPPSSASCRPPSAAAAFSTCS